MTDLVERLLTCASQSEMGRNFAGTPQACREAAKALAERDARIAELEGALKGIQVRHGWCKDRCKACETARTTLGEMAP